MTDKMEDVFVLKNHDMAVIWLITSNSSNLGGLKPFLGRSLAPSASKNRNLIPNISVKTFLLIKL